LAACSNKFRSLELVRTMQRWSLFALLLLLTGFTSKAQVIKINPINSYLSKEDEAYFSKIAAFEVKFFNAVFSTQKKR
jgi:hypothetical protein